MKRLIFVLALLLAVTGVFFLSGCGRQTGGKASEDNLMEVAGKAMQIGYYTMAIDSYQQVLQLDPGNLQAKDGLLKAQVLNETAQGDKALQAKNFANAVAFYKQALQLSPKDPVALKKLDLATRLAALDKWVSWLSTRANLVSQLLDQYDTSQPKFLLDQSAGADDSGELKTARQNISSLQAEVEKYNISKEFAPSQQALASALASLARGFSQAMNYLAGNDASLALSRQSFAASNTAFVRFNQALQGEGQALGIKVDNYSLNWPNQ